MHESFSLVIKRLLVLSFHSLLLLSKSLFMSFSQCSLTLFIFSYGLVSLLLSLSFTRSHLLDSLLILPLPLFIPQVFLVSKFLKLSFSGLELVDSLLILSLQNTSQSVGLLLQNSPSSLIFISQILSPSAILLFSGKLSLLIIILLV